MSTKTANYNLAKPSGTDNVDIGVINSNMDLIDQALTAKETTSGAQAKADDAEANAKGYADTAVAALPKIFYGSTPPAEMTTMDLWFKEV